MSQQKGYARLSNDLWRSPTAMKMLAVNPAALAYYIAAISYASDNLTDGRLDETVVRYVLRVPDDVIDYLVDEGKWEPAADGGWRIHNYDKWQNSRADIEAARARDRERKTRKPATPSTKKDSERNPHGIQPDADVNPTTPFNQNQNQNQNQNTSSHEEVGEARASAPATAAAETRSESELIDVWEPDASCIAYADELERAGHPRVDLGALATRFRRKLHARGLAAYKLRATPKALSAEFCTWIDTEVTILTQQPKPAAQPTRHMAESSAHRHTWDCDHVQARMSPHEADYDHERHGWGASDWMTACAAEADRLNQAEGLTDPTDEPEHAALAEGGAA